MIYRSRALRGAFAGLALALLGLSPAVGATESKAEPGTEDKAAPTSPSWTELEPGVYVSEHLVQRPQQPPLRVWLYSPTDPPTPGLGLVTVAPAGSILITGMGLGEGDRPEHLPYVRAEWAVVSYELDGAASENDTDEEAGLAMLAFAASRAGVDNGALALDAALEHLPAPDLDRVFAAGHSSAGTHALVFAALEPRIKAVAAYASVTDLRAYLGRAAVKQLVGALPTYGAFLDLATPLSYGAELSAKPVFLFAARDDQGHPREEKRLLAAMETPHPKTTSVFVARGGHYDSMITDGIPAGIRWMKSLTTE